MDMPSGTHHYYVAGDGTVWKRALVEARSLEHAEAEAAQLRKQNVETREAWRARAATIEAKMFRIAAARDTLEAERDNAQAEVVVLRQDLDDARASSDEMRTERDEAIAASPVLIDERGRLLLANTVTTVERERAIAERDEALAAHVATKDALRVALDETVRLQEWASELATSRDDVQRELHYANAEIDRLMQN